jgi:hypothetical protein
MATTTELLKRQIDAIENLKNLPSSDTPEFKQWEQLTKAIIDRRLGKVKVGEFPSGFDFWPNRMGPWEDEELKESLLRGLGMAEAYLNGLIQEIELLGEDEAQGEERPSSQTHGKLKFGEPGRNGQPGSGGSISINGHIINITDAARISADGGHANSTHGNNSPIIANAAKIDNLISQLEDEIENSYNKEDKEEVKTIVKELKSQAEAGNERGFKQLAGVLLTRGAEIAQMSSLVIQLLMLGSGVK